jgi:tetratricopeptide (TPR) repeat protein
MIYFLVLIMSFVFNISFSQNFESKFKEANSLYENEQFVEAIDLYEELTNNNITSADLFYNLGNAYYRVNNIGLSIYNYSRALKLNPSDEDIKFNLEIAKLKTIDKFDEVPKFFLDDLSNTISNLFNESTWTFINLFFAILTGVFIVLFNITRDIFVKKLSIILSFLVIGLFLVSFYFGYHQSNYQFKATNGVIISPSAYIKSGPDDKSTDILILHEGTTFDLLEEYKDWNKIKLSDGNVGWIDDESILTY